MGPDEIDADDARRGCREPTGPWPPLPPPELGGPPYDDDAPFGAEEEDVKKLTEAQLVERGRELVSLLAEIDKAEEARAEANAEAKSAIKALEGRADALREVISSGEEEGEQGRLFEGGGRVVTSVTLTAADGRRIAKSMGND